MVVEQTNNGILLRRILVSNYEADSLPPEGVKIPSEFRIFRLGFLIFFNLQVYPLNVWCQVRQSRENSVAHWCFYLRLIVIRS